MEAKNILASLWIFTLAATEIRGEIVSFVVAVYTFYIVH